MSEKRAHLRKLMREPAVLADAAGKAREPVVLLDISHLGVSFTSATMLDSGSRHILEFHMPGHPALHETVIQVVHSSDHGVPGGYRVGARFVHILAETRDCVAGYVSLDGPA